MTYTAWFDEIRKDDIALAGGKGANLGELSHAGLPVPAGFVLTTTAYDAFVEANSIEEAILGRASVTRADDPAVFEEIAEAIRALFSGGKVPEEMADEIRAAYQKLSEDAVGTPVAARSSATAEDLPGMSFAGQQETYLNIRGAEALLDGVKNCWASLWTARAMAYRARQGVDPATVSLGGGPKDGRVGGRGRDVHRQPLQWSPGSGDDKRRVGPWGIGGKRLGDAGFYRRGEAERTCALARDFRQTSHDRLL